MSSVVLSSQRVPAAAKKGSGPHPLVQNQTELVPNITHVFTQDQHLYLQYEVYDAARGKNPAAASGANGAANSGAINAVSGVANGGLNVALSDAPKNVPQAKAPKDSVRVLLASSFCRAAQKFMSRSRFWRMKLLLRIVAP